MSNVCGREKTPSGVEKMDGVLRFKPDTTSARAQHSTDLGALAKGGLKVDELAAIVGRLIERVKELEEG